MSNLAKKDETGLVAPKTQADVSQALMAQVGQQVRLIPGVDEAYRFRIPRLGKFHQGVKVQKEITLNDGTKKIIEAPEKTPWFVLPPELHDNEEFREALAKHNADPDRPTKIPIRLLSSNIAINVSKSFDEYNSAHILLARWDGEECIRLNRKTGEYEKRPCYAEGECKDCITRGAGRWITRLRFILPNYPGFGYWQVDTISRKAFQELTSQMYTIFRMLRGHLGGIDLLLVKGEASSQTVLMQRDGKAPQLDQQGNAKIIAAKYYPMRLDFSLSPRKLDEVIDSGKFIDYDSTNVEIEEFDRSDDDPAAHAEEAEFSPAANIDDDGSFEVGEPEQESVQDAEVVPSDEDPPFGDIDLITDDGAPESTPVGDEARRKAGVSKPQNPDPAEARRRELTDSITQGLGDKRIESTVLTAAIREVNSGKVTSLGKLTDEQLESVARKVGVI